MYKFLCRHVFMSLGCIYLKVELLGFSLKDFFKLSPEEMMRLKEKILV